MSSTSQILRSAKELIKNPANWTIGAYARDCSGIACCYESDRAVCFCSMGAVFRAQTFHFFFGFPFKYLTQAIGLPVESLSHFNDMEGHAAVLEMYDVAIQLAEEEEGHHEKH